MTAAALSPRSRAIVATYARSNPWLTLADLQQEATLAALQASSTWREDGGTTLDLWVAWKVALALSRYVAEQRCPASLPKRKGESWHEASTARREQLEVRLHGYGDGPDQRTDHPDVARVAADAWEPLEVSIDRERAIARVRAIMDEQAEAARLVLLAEEKSASVAERLGLSYRRVTDLTAAARLALRAAFCTEAA